MIRAGYYMFPAPLRIGDTDQGQLATGNVQRIVRQNRVGTLSVGNK